MAAYDPYGWQYSIAGDPNAVATTATVPARQPTPYQPTLPAGMTVPSVNIDFNKMFSSPGFTQYMSPAEQHIRAIDQEHQRRMQQMHAYMQNMPQQPWNGQQEPTASPGGGTTGAPIQGRPFDQQRHAQWRGMARDWHAQYKSAAPQSSNNTVSANTNTITPQVKLPSASPPSGGGWL